MSVRGSFFAAGAVIVAVLMAFTGCPAPTGNSRTVSYNGNGATGGNAPTDGNDYQLGATVTVLGNTGALVKTGYVFAGWNTEADGSGVSYSVGASFSMGTATVTLFAIWTLAFSYSSVLFGPPSTLGIWLTALNVSTGAVTYNGVDTTGPTTPFTWDWGDGQVNDGWFPQNHTYSDRTHNYVLTVTSHYGGSGTDSVSAVVRFAVPQLTPMSFPPDLAVTVPDRPVSLSTRLYAPPSSLTFFTDAALGGLPRSAVEHILTAGAIVQAGFVEGNVYRDSGGFPQVLLNDPGFGGMYSVWYTTPVALAAGGSSLSLSNASSYFHEMGHNVTLNFPANYYYGGRVDGNANAIYSETMAQIFQHATAYWLVNHASDYGLCADVVADLKNSALASMKLVRNSYDTYVTNPVFHSWNDPATTPDETFNTFMTLAYVFCKHAETSGTGYYVPLMRMMRLLGKFDAGLLAQYDPQHDTTAADTFRSTLMVAAESYAFDADLRPEFRNLSFPIDDPTYQQLITAAAQSQPLPPP